MMHSSSRPWSLAGGVAVAAAAVMLITQSAMARPLDQTGRGAAGGPAWRGSPLPPDHAWTVTLITGDVVQVRTVRGGPPLVVVQPRPGRENVTFSEFVSPSGQIEVVPQDVAPLLGRVLDPALFDVTTLIANGDDNAHRSYLPLIVRCVSHRLCLPLRGQDGRSTVRERRTGAARMGRTLAAAAVAVLRAGRVTPLATKGIRHIWLAQTGRRARSRAETGVATAQATAAPSVRLALKAIPIPGTAAGQMSAFAYVVNIGNPKLFDREVPINATGCIRWFEEVGPPLTGQNLANEWALERPGLIRYAPGSQHAEGWVRQPFRPGPYSGTIPALGGCVPRPTVRLRGEIHVELIDLQDRPDAYDCLRLGPPPNPWLQVTSRTMRLFRGGKLIASKHSSSADFAVPGALATYKLVYTDNTARALPVSARTQTTWTFRSAAPAGNDAVRIPLLLVDYALPLGLDNHPDGSTAVFTVARVAGTLRARVTGFRLWTSLDKGHTWQASPVHVLGGGRFSATLPHVARGKAISLRVQATDAGGSGIEQTIMTAYHG